MAITCLLTIFFSFTLIGSALAECENPDVLTFSIIPAEETIQELTIYKPVIDVLSKMTWKKVEFYMPTSYSTVVQYLADKGVKSIEVGGTRPANNMELIKELSKRQIFIHKKINPLWTPAPAPKIGPVGIESGRILLEQNAG